MQISIVDAHFLLAAITSMAIDPLVPQPTRCEACGKDSLEPDDRNHVTSEMRGGEVVLIACDGRWTVDPKFVGVYVVEWVPPGSRPEPEPGWPGAGPECGGCSATPGDQRGPWHDEQCGRWAAWPTGPDAD